MANRGEHREMNVIAPSEGGTTAMTILIANRQDRGCTDSFVRNARTAPFIQTLPHPADICCVTVRASWLYTRASSSVCIEVLEEPTCFILVVYGPGQQWHPHVCVDYLEAMRGQFVYEEQFLARGYML